MRLFISLRRSVLFLMLLAMPGALPAAVSAQDFSLCDVALEIVPDVGSVLQGYSGNDMLVGGEGADELYGGSGNDMLYGTEGEVLDEGSGQDETITAVPVGADCELAQSFDDLNPVSRAGFQLSYCNLSNMHLDGANLDHANLSDSFLTDANLTGANLSYANLSSVGVYGDGSGPDDRATGVMDWETAYNHNRSRMCGSPPPWR